MQMVTKDKKANRKQKHCYKPVSSNIYTALNTSMIHILPQFTGSILQYRLWTTEDEMVGWRHQLDGHEFEQALGTGDGRGSLACCSPWGRKEWEMTEQQTELTDYFRKVSVIFKILK